MGVGDNTKGVGEGVMREGRRGEENLERLEGKGKVGRGR
jgi:hypothetical protein